MSFVAILFDQNRLSPRRFSCVSRLLRLAILLSCFLLLACSRPGTASPQGDRAAADRAAAAESTQAQAQPGGARAQVRPSLLGGGDLATVYRSILDSYVDQVDYTRLIESAATGLRESVRAAGALPADTAPLDLLPLPSGNPERDWASFSSTFDSVVQRHPEWSLQSRPDYAAVRRMLQSLDDSHSSFIGAEETRRRGETSYSDIGIRLSRLEPQGPPVIVQVFQSSPAAVAGVRIGDRILRVGDRAVAGIPLSDVADLIRGPQGSEVVLDLERSAAGGPVGVRAFRRSIDTPQAEGQLLDQRVGYIRIWSFGETVAERVGRYLTEQRQAGAQAWIIDVRANPGGNLAAVQRAAGYFIENRIDVRANPGVNLGAVQRVAGYFIENRLIGVSVDRSGQRQAIFGEQRPFSVRAPVAILIDGDSGSGSEILASALREYQIATVVGQKSAGSAGMANGIQLSDGSTAQLTVRRLLSASGAQIDRIGVQPDESVPLTALDLEANRDPQRDRALELLRQRLRAS